MGSFSWLKADGSAIIIDELKYPLKLVSTSYNGTYEDFKTYSYCDPDQGFY
jgi:hypothetical protein